jgi:hypothetical protein
MTHQCEAKTQNPGIEPKYADYEGRHDAKCEIQCDIHAEIEAKRVSKPIFHAETGAVDRRTNQSGANNVACPQAGDGTAGRDRGDGLTRSRIITLNVRQSQDTRTPAKDTRRTTVGRPRKRAAD